MEKFRNYRANPWIAGPTIVIWYLWSIMFVCFSQSLIETQSSWAGLSAHGGKIPQASVAHEFGFCDAPVNIDADSNYCETENGPGVASDLTQFGLAALQFAWYLIPDWHESIALPIVDSILEIPALRIFLQICSFLK